MASAQGLSIPGLSSAGKAPAAAQAPASAERSAEDWAARLDAARSRHRVLLAQPEGSEPLLAERQLASARRLLLLTARVDELKARSAGGSPGKAAEPQGPALTGAPPYGVLEVDRLRDELDSLAAEQAALRLNLKSMDATIESAIKARDEARADLRLRREQTERAGQGAGTPALQAQIELSELVSEVAELEAVQTDEARRRARDRLAALDEPIRALQAEIGRVRGQLRLDESELRPILDGLAADRQRLAAEGAKLAQRLARRESESGGNGASRGAEIEHLNDAMQIQRELDGVVHGIELLWVGRRELLSRDVGPQERRATAVKLDASLQASGNRLDRLTEESRLVRSEFRAQQALLANLPAADAARAREQAILDSLRTKFDLQERLRDALERRRVLAQRTRADLGLSDVPASPQEWLARAGALAAGWAASIWNYELFSATSTTEIDGRLVTVDHGVTVGKSVGVVVLFLFGYWAAGRLSRSLVEAMARRLQLSAQLARVLRRWINAVLVVVILLIVLKMARIPLTAFAFLGGALAIGIGFGAQNVIKNLISGVIILFERKIRVGDIVSIGGTAGTVVTVDLRATTVRGFDGIDAIVPNSSLLENQISNWSGGSPDVRRAIGVGVAYGTDLRKAAEIIAGCALAHPSVLDTPAPEVLLDDFGGDDLKFKLLYWTRLGGLRPGASVDSDLRFAIFDALQAAGIAMAFPQRDVHLDASGPIRVELSGGNALRETSARPKPGE